VLGQHRSTQRYERRVAADERAARQGDPRFDARVANLFKAARAGAPR
jgi:hypothetical protein